MNNLRLLLLKTLTLFWCIQGIAQKLPVKETLYYQKYVSAGVRIWADYQHKEYYNNSTYNRIDSIISYSDESISDYGMHYKEVFKYDSYGKLIVDSTYYTYYDEGYVIKYSYDLEGKVIKDSVIYYPYSFQVPSVPVYPFRTDYNYNVEGNLVKKSAFERQYPYNTPWSEFPERTVHYQYDQNKREIAQQDSLYSSNTQGYELLREYKKEWTPEGRLAVDTFINYEPGYQGKSFKQYYYNAENDLDSIVVFRKYTLGYNPVTKITFDYALTSGVSTDKIKNTLVCYPNPATSEVQFKLSEGEQIVELSLYDLSGRLMKKYAQWNAQSFTLNIDWLMAGAYYIHLKTTQNTYHEKLLKNTF